MIMSLIINIKYFEIIHLITLLTINTNNYENNKMLLLLAIILVLKVEPTDGEMFTAIVFGVLSAIVSYLSRD